MKRQFVDVSFKKFPEKLGISVHAHKFKHNFAVKAIKDDVPLNVLLQWMDGALKRVHHFNLYADNRDGYFRAYGEVEII